METVQAIPFLVGDRGMRPTAVLDGIPCFYHARDFWSGERRKHVVGVSEKCDVRYENPHAVLRAVIPISIRAMRSTGGRGVCVCHGELGGFRHHWAAAERLAGHANLHRGMRHHIFEHLPRADDQGGY